MILITLITSVAFAVGAFVISDSIMGISLTGFWFLDWVIGAIMMVVSFVILTKYLEKDRDS